MATLDIGHLVPLDNENRWTDLLAVLIEADPVSAAPFPWLTGGS